MKIVLVCKGKPIWELSQLTEELQGRGHEVTLISPSIAVQDFLSEDFWAPYTQADVVYYRTGFGDGARLGLFEKLREVGVAIINASALQNTLLSNKIHQAVRAQKIGVLVPETLIGRGRSYSTIVERLGLPFILKAAEGIQGKKVFLITSETEYQEHIDDLDGDILMQKFIPNEGDFRVFVVGGQVRAIFQRIPKPGDFRANISQGGSGRPVPAGELYDALSQIAVAITKAQQLDIAGIDIMQSTATGELFFIEANVNPGWKGLEAALGSRVTNHVADFIVTAGAEH